MFKFIAKILAREKALKAHLTLTKITPENNDWLLFLVNRHYLFNSPFTREVDLYQKNEFTQIKLASLLEISNLRFSIFKNQTEVINYETGLDRTQFVDNFNALIDHFIGKNIAIFTTHLNNQKMISDTNLEKEEKAFEWLRVTLKVLDESLDHFYATKKSDGDDREELGMSLFMGKNPKSALFEIRLLIFNLDLQFILLNDGNLRLRVYNLEKLSLEGDFSLKKREMFDLLIKLLFKLRDGFAVN